MCKLCTINQEQAEAFAGRMLQMFNHGSLALMISLGHRANLFNIMANRGPMGCDEIAKKSKLDGRYVKEWLASMVTGEIIEYESTMDKYRLPDEHAAFLTKNAGSDNFATLFQFIPVMCSVEDELLECFKSGGGVPYEKFHRFHEVMAEDSGQNFRNNMLSKILPLVKGLVDRLDDGIKVLDVGCGSGTALNTMAKIFPNSTFLGVDLCEEPLKQARNDAAMLNLTNVNFFRGDATHLKMGQEFDLITTFDAIHDQAYPDKVLDNIYLHLSKKGVYLMVDIDASSKLEENLKHPLAPALYSISTSHCMTVSLAQGGMGLGTMWGRQKACEMLKTAGFKKTDIKRVDGDIMNAYYISHK